MTLNFKDKGVLSTNVCGIWLASRPNLAKHKARDLTSHKLWFLPQTLAVCFYQPAKRSSTWPFHFSNKQLTLHINLLFWSAKRRRKKKHVISYSQIFKCNLMSHLIKSRFHAFKNTLHFERGLGQGAVDFQRYPTRTEPDPHWALLHTVGSSCSLCLTLLTLGLTLGSKNPVESATKCAWTQTQKCFAS